MDRLQFILKLLREIHINHLATVGGFRFDLLLANDRTMLALINGDESAVWQFANMAWCAYAQLEIPGNVALAASLTKLVTTTTTPLTAA